MAQWVKCLQQKCEDPSSDPQPGCNGEYLSSQGSSSKVEVETGESLEVCGLESLSAIPRLLFLVIKHHEQTAPGGNRLFHIIQFHRGKTGQEYKQDKNLEAELKPGPWRSAAKTHLFRDGTTYKGWDLPHRSLSKTVPHRLPYRSDLMGTFPQL